MSNIHLCVCECVDPSLSCFFFFLRSVRQWEKCLPDSWCRLAVCLETKQQLYWSSTALHTGNSFQSMHNTDISSTRLPFYSLLFKTFCFFLVRSNREQGRREKGVFFLGRKMLLFIWGLIYLTLRSDKDQVLLCSDMNNVKLQRGPKCFSPDCRFFLWNQTDQIRQKRKHHVACCMTHYIVWSVYPFLLLLSLLTAYEQCANEAEKEKLLSCIRYGKLKRFVAHSRDSCSNLF